MCRAIAVWSVFLCLGVARVFAQPCNATTYINPALHSSQCIEVCPGSVCQIHVYGPLGSTQIPVFMMLPDCNPMPGTLCEYECPFPPGPIFWQYDETAWTYNSIEGSWDNFIYGTGEGCLCVTFAAILAAELVSFDAIAGDHQVTLRWTTASESNNDAFEIKRDGELIGEVPSRGNSATGFDYEWTDGALVNSLTYTYELIARDIGGGLETIGTTSATPRPANDNVSDYKLLQNYPNPFNPTTSISFDLVEEGLVTLTIFDTQGREVAPLLRENREAGRHQIEFNGAGLPSGMYLCRLQVNGFSAIQKMVLMK